MSIRIATFNAENLFARYKFKKNFDPSSGDGFTINDLAFDIFDETEKQITAQAIQTVNADIIALQEVESLPVLDAFNSRYLAKMKYKYRILIDSFDPRKIDVAVLSRHPITNVRSRREERNSSNTAWLFSRDCLEVIIKPNGKEIMVYVNHFKSMMEGREETKSRRKEQVDRVAAIVNEHWMGKGYQGNFVVLGDFNDYPEAETALGALLNHPVLENVVNRLSPDNRWTHFYASGNEYRQLDYILLSTSLSAANANIKPGILRNGLPFRADKYEGERFPNVGENEPKASDHAPVYMDLDLP